MGNLYETISSLCDEKGIKGAKMCNDTGISKGLLTDLKMGRRTGVSAVTAQKIAAYFGVSVGYLLGEEEKKENPTAASDGISEKRKALIEFVMTISEEEADRALQALKLLLKAD